MRLRSRFILAVLAALGALLGTAALVAALGGGAVIREWSASEAARLSAEAGSRLAALAERGALSQAAVAAELDELAALAEYLIVTDPAGSVLYARRGFGLAPGQGRNFLRRVEGSLEWREVPSPRAEGYRYAVLAQDFSGNESNRALMSALILLAGAGAAAGLALGIGFALLLSAPAARQARALASALGRMREGRRDVALPASGIRELAEISQGAESLQDALRREEHIRRQWAADVAHDLRTPVASILAQAEGIIAGVREPSADRMGRMAAEARNLSSLIDGLAELARIETPGFAPSKARFDPQGLIDELIARFEERARGQGSTLSRGPAPIGAIDADRGLVLRALSNFVDNALRYGKPAGRVEIACRAEGAMASFDVENEGTMSEEAMERAFDRLYRAEPSRSTEGMGLGAAIAKAIAEAHGGSVRATAPEPGRIRFSLIIPLA